MSKGFTIIELIIAIFILSAGVVGIYSAFSVVVILTANASDRLAAAYLAQEGAEIIRNIRDSNWLNMDLHPDTALWNDGLSFCENGASCNVDYKTMGSGSNSVRPWIGGEADYLKIESGFYNYESGPKSKFKRKITIDNSLAPYILKVLVQVSWDEKATLLSPDGYEAGECFSSRPNCIQVEETLYDWY